MTEDERQQLPTLAWMSSRIPKRMALVTFVPDGPECPEPVRAAADGHPSRWYPQPGGHRVLILYEGGPYDSTAFRLDPKAWDHEDCDICGARIAPMELCHVTETGDYIALCQPCYRKHVLLIPTNDAEPIEEKVSVHGPIEKEEGKLVLRIPLAVGGQVLLKYATGIGHVDGHFLKVEIKPSMAELLEVSEGTIVSVDNLSGEFRIQRYVEEEPDQPPEPMAPSGPGSS